MERLISYFPSGIRKPDAKPTDEITLQEFVEGVKNGQWRAAVDEVRAIEDKPARTAKKVQLPYTTLSANYEGQRKKGLEKYLTNYVALDLDSGKLDYIKDFYVRAQFRSVSGKGLCVVVEVSEIEDYKHTFANVSKYFEAVHEVEVDPACKDSTRARFVTYDPTATWNESSNVFQVPKYTEVSNKAVEPKVKEEWSYETTRNFVSGLNHQGFARTAAQEMLLSLDPTRWEGSSTFGEESIRETNLIKLVDSIYDIYSDQNGQAVRDQKRLKIGKASTYKQIESDTGLYKRVRPLLPRLLQDICDSFTREGDQDTALMAALPLFSQLLINSYFEMGSVGIQSPNLFSFIVGEAGSGKSIVGQVVKMFDKIEQEFHEERMRRFDDYKMWMGCKEAEKKEWIESGRSEPANEFTGFFMPSDVTAASMLKNANETSGLGVMFASEADTLSKFAGGENSISTALRVAYEGESISQSRLGDTSALRMPIKIDKLNLSVLITSTPEQVRTLIGNVEDGLFSRFMFETLPNTERIISLFKTKRIDHALLQDKVFEFYKRSKYTQKKPTADMYSKSRSFDHKFLEPKDEDYMPYIEQMDALLQDLTGNVSKSLSSSVTRATTRIFRIALILSAMKLMEQRDLRDVEEFDSASLKAAFEIVATSLSKTVGIMSIFGDDISSSKKQDDKANTEEIETRLAICKEVAEDSNIPSTKRVAEAVSRLNDVGQRMSTQQFRNWKNTYQRRHDVTVL